MQERQRWKEAGHKGPVKTPDAAVYWTRVSSGSTTSVSTRIVYIMAAYRRL